MRPPKYADVRVVIPVRYLCSHLVLLIRPGGSADDCPALLEEISASQALLSAENAVPPGERVAVETEGFSIWVTVDACEQREGGYILTCAFDAGFRWRPELWAPDHLYQIEPRKKAAGSS